MAADLYGMKKFEYRNRNRVYDAVLRGIEEAAEAEGVNRKVLAERIGKDQGQISRLLSGPSNWTLDTISNLLFAIHAEMDYTVVNIGSRQRSNIHHVLSVDAPKSSNVTPKTSTDARAVTVKLGTA